MATPFNVQISPSGQLAMVSLTGEFDIASAPELRQVLEGARGQGGRTLVLDFAQVRFLDSTCLGVLVGANKRVRADGGRMIAVNVTGIPLKVMAITGLAGAFEMYGAEQALEAELAALLAELQSETVSASGSETLVTSGPETPGLV